ncbi:hypothetical protein AN958_05964 [Leucoagaricus sp. SymC.cos]|nr:hypothetical protein AN958_05964 [Leucoagaricus sp. SymC.cos]
MSTFDVDAAFKHIQECDLGEPEHSVPPPGPPPNLQDKIFANNGLILLMSLMSVPCFMDEMNDD